MSDGRFAVLARYNAWANRRLYAACADLSEADYMAPRQAFFGSLHGTLNHILVGDRLWLGRLVGDVPAIPALDTVLYDGFAALRAAREAQDAAAVAFVDGLSPADLEAVLTYRTMAGEPQRTPVHWVLTHMFNHATHHRGQAHDLLSQVPADPPPLDLIYFLRESGITA
ncbi:MAG: damage-inducible protein DinB [Hyphomicrobiales bacterium]|nr:damage-inducible protein DinB [Hyphomicrobiales bacterium]